MLLWIRLAALVATGLVATAVYYFSPLLWPGALTPLVAAGVVMAAGLFVLQAVDASLAAARQSALQHQIADIRQHLSTRGSASAADGSDMPAANDAVVSELRLLKTQLSRYLDQHTEIKGLHAGKPNAPEPEPVSMTPPAGSPPPRPHGPTTTATKGEDSARVRVISNERELLQVMQQSLAENRVDLYLQPLVQLPARRTVHYECFSRLRDADGHMVLPRHYMALAESQGLSGTIDNLLLFRLIQLLRGLGPRHEGVRFFCNLSAASLGDEEFFPQFIDYMRSAQEFADRMVFELTESDYSTLTHDTRSQLDALADAGFHLSLDNVSSLTDAQRISDWASARVRYAKVNIATLLATGDVSRQRAAVERFAKDHITLIASHMESERHVLAALDARVDWGQGYHLGMPQSPDALAGSL